MKTATISQIAEALDKTTQAINQRKRLQNWQSTGERVRGGGDTYDISTLSLDKKELSAIKRYLEKKQAAIIADLPTVQETAVLPAVISPAENVTTATLANYQRTCMEARLHLLLIIKTNAPSMGVKGAINALVKAVNGFDAILPENIRAAVEVANARHGKSDRTLSPRTVLRWWSDWKKSGYSVISLAPATLKDPFSGKVLATQKLKQEPAWVRTFMPYWKTPSKVELTDVLRKMEGDGVANIPSYDQARRYLKNLGILEASKGRLTGRDLQTLKPYRRRLTDHMYPNDAWTADGHTWDAEVAHPIHGKPFRPEITPVLDIATRKCLGWSCDTVEKGLSVLDALRMGCENYGPPVIFYTDNGKGYRNQMMTASGTGILDRLGITPEYSRPGNPQAHGLSERAHKTILVKAAKELITYIGKDMDSDTQRLVFKETRKAAEKDRISLLLLEWDDFVAMVNAAIEVYNNRPHTSLATYRDNNRKRTHLTPNQAYAFGIQKLQKDLPREYWPEPAGELPELYHPAETRTANQGWIELHRKFYYAPELQHFTGEKVSISYSPSDPTYIHAWRLDTGSLIAKVKLEGNSAPYFAKSKIEIDREKSATAKLKLLQKKTVLLELEASGPAHLTIVPPAAAQARENLKQIIQAEQTPPAPAKPVFQLPPTQRGKYKYWCEIENRLSEGGDVLPEELNFHAKFQLSQAWRSECEVAEFARMQACK